MGVYGIEVYGMGYIWHRGYNLVGRRGGVIDLEAGVQGVIYILGVKH